MVPGVRIEGRPSFSFRSISRACELRQFIIVDPEVVQVHCCVWLSPLRCFVKKVECDGIVLLATEARPMSLLRAAALAGFIGNEVSQLRYIANQLKVDASGDAFDLVLRLCKRVLGEGAMESEVGLAAMAQRVKSTAVDFDTKMLDQEMVASCLAPDDAKEFEDYWGAAGLSQARQLA